MKYDTLRKVVCWLRKPTKARGFTNNQYDRALRLPNKPSSQGIFNEYQSKSNFKFKADNSQTGIGISTSLINKSIDDKLKKNKKE